MAKKQTKQEKIDELTEALQNTRTALHKTRGELSDLEELLAAKDELVAFVDQAFKGSEVLLNQLIGAMLTHEKAFCYTEDYRDRPCELKNVTAGSYVADRNPCAEAQERPYVLDDRPDVHSFIFILNTFRQLKSGILEANKVLSVNEAADRL